MTTKITTKKTKAQTIADAEGVVTLTNAGRHPQRFTVALPGVGGDDEIVTYTVEPGDSVDVSPTIAQAVAHMNDEGTVIRGLAPMLVPNLPNYRGVHPSLVGASEPAEAVYEPILPGAA